LSNEKKLLEMFSKKTVSAHWGGRTVEFEIPTTGFSSFQLDHGTIKLLRQIEADQFRAPRAIDLGCGYGPIALFLSVTKLADRITGIDRDALAVAFAARNAEKNKISNCSFSGGLGYEQLPAGEKYDAILSNLPAKAGEPVHESMLLDAGQFLNPGGQVAMVVVTPLEERIDKILARDEIFVKTKIRTTDHIVYVYEFRGSIPPVAWPYVRERLSQRWNDFSYDMETVFGLPEFDSLSWQTESILDTVVKKRNKLNFGKIMVCNPGQGHIPVLLSKIAGQVDEMTLVSRDMLSVRQSAANVETNGQVKTIRREHAVVFQPAETGNEVDLCVGVLNDKEGLEINQEKIAQVRAANKNATLFFGSPISFALRLEKILKKGGIKATTTKKHQGNAVIECYPDNK